MLVKPLLDELLPKVDTRYTLAMLVAKRTRQLVDGAQPMVEEDTPNLVTLACEEVVQGKIACVQGVHQIEVPIRPEIEEARRLAAELAAIAEIEALKEANDLAMENERKAAAAAAAAMAAIMGSNDGEEDFSVEIEDVLKDEDSENVKTEEVVAEPKEDTTEE